MPFTRRTFLKLIPSFLLAGLWSRVNAEPVTALVERILPTFLDTLMPADESPSASSLGVHNDILEKSTGDDHYRRLLVKGCRWLEQVSLREFDVSFDRLSDRQQFIVVDKMANMNKRTIAHVFFKRLQADLFDYYYARPASWQGLGINRPPQPLGYNDYNRKPDSV